MSGAGEPGERGAQPAGMEDETAKFLALAIDLLGEQRFVDLTALPDIAAQRAADPSGARILEGLVFYASGDNARALESLAAARAFGCEPATWMALALALLNAARLEEALDAANAAVGDAPDNSHAQRIRGLVLGTMGRLDEAIASFDAAIAIDAKNYAAYGGKGAALQQLGRHLEAVEAFSRVIDADNTAQNPIAWLSRAESYLEIAEPRAALADLEAAENVAPELPRIQVGKYLALQIIGETDAALAALERGTTLAPTDVEIWRLRAGATLEAGRRGECLECLRQLVELDPNDAKSWDTIATLATQRGDYALAMRAAAEAQLGSERKSFETSLQAERAPCAHTSDRIDASQYLVRTRHLPAWAPTWAQGVFASAFYVWLVALRVALVAATLGHAGMRIATNYVVSAIWLLSPVWKFVVVWFAVWVVQYFFFPRWLISSPEEMNAVANVLPGVVLAVFAVILASVFVLGQQVVSLYGTRSVVVLISDARIRALLIEGFIVAAASVLIVGILNPTHLGAAAALATTTILASLAYIGTAFIGLVGLLGAYTAPRSFVLRTVHEVPNDLRRGWVQAVIFKVPALGEMMRQGLRRGESAVVTAAVEGIERIHTHYIDAAQSNPLIRFQPLSGVHGSVAREGWIGYEAGGALLRAGQEALNTGAAEDDGTSIALALERMVLEEGRHGLWVEATAMIEAVAQLGVTVHQVRRETVNLWPQSAWTLAKVERLAEAQGEVDRAAHVLALWALVVTYPLTQFGEPHRNFGPSILELGPNPPWSPARDVIRSTWRRGWANKMPKGIDPLLEALAEGERQHDQRTRGGVPPSSGPEFP